jgi:hypothetical protein
MIALARETIDDVCFVELNVTRQIVYPKNPSRSLVNARLRVIRIPLASLQNGFLRYVYRLIVYVDDHASLILRRSRRAVMSIIWNSQTEN